MSICICFKRYKIEDQALISFEILNNDKTEIINVWKNDDDVYYAFIPSYADFESIFIKNNTGTNLFIDDIEITGDINLNQLPLSEQHILSFIGGGKCPSIYISSPNYSIF